MPKIVMTTSSGMYTTDTRDLETVCYVLADCNVPTLANILSDRVHGDDRESEMYALKYDAMTLKIMLADCSPGCADWPNPFATGSSY